MPSQRTRIHQIGRPAGRSSYIVRTPYVRIDEAHIIAQCTYGPFCVLCIQWWTLRRMDTSTGSCDLRYGMELFCQNRKGSHIMRCIIIISSVRCVNASVCPPVSHLDSSTILLCCAFVHFPFQPDNWTRALMDELWANVLIRFQLNEVVQAFFA